MATVWFASLYVTIQPELRSTVFEGVCTVGCVFAGGVAEFQTTTTFHAKFSTRQSPHHEHWLHSKEHQAGFNFREPRYDSSESQKAFAEFNDLLAATFGDNPLPEYMDLMMYGFGQRIHKRPPTAPYSRVRSDSLEKKTRPRFANLAPETSLGRGRRLRLRSESGTGSVLRAQTGASRNRLRSYV